MALARKIVAGGVLAAAMLGALGSKPASAQAAAGARDADGLEEISVDAPKRLPPLRVAPAGTPSATGSSLEEVTVRGRRSMFSYRVEIEAARDRIYDTFNELNSHDEFDITCDREQPTGTRIPQRRCRPQFLKEAQADAARAYLDALLFGQGGEAAMSRAMVANGVARAKQQQLVEEMERVVTEHPELAAAFVEYFELQEEYREAREARTN